MNYKQFLAVAIEAAQKAGKIHLGFQQKGFKIDHKQGTHDLLTEADTASEKAVTQCIYSYFPDHNILGEEDVYPETDSPYRWIIDPLDGTNNFSKGIPQYAVSIALAFQGEMIVGVVFDPSKDELFHALKGEGAFLNGNKISVSGAVEFQQAVVCTGFYYDRGDQMRETLANIEAFFESGIIGMRRLGAAALDLCYVACGRLDMYWEFLLSPWDFAAGSLIVAEAGGRVSNRQGEDLPIEPSYVVATNGSLHEKMLGVLNRD